MGIFGNDTGNYEYILYITNVMGDYIIILVNWNCHGLMCKGLRVYDKASIEFYSPKRIIKLRTRKNKLNSTLWLSLQNEFV